MAERIFTDRDFIRERLQGLFDQMPLFQHQAVLDSISVYRFKKDDLVYVEESNPTDCMFLLEGKVKVYKSGIDERDLIVRLIRSGEYFGYASHFAGCKYSTRAAALEPSLICFIPIEAIDDLANSNLRVATYIIRCMARNMQLSDDRMLTLTQKHVRGRLAEALLLIHDTYGTREDGKTLCLSPSRRDLADLSNMTTNNAIRT
ncbi:MAG: Crp/Fnr family transcriptional regulator, partial [Prevotellaceae bacterium]|nr:Crp/Fnr family transcriptional regulator [Prevotellaceae bacterium]